jgi:cytosine deaminase
MCAGASMIYGISTIVIGENRTFEASEAIMRSSGIEIIVLDDLPTLSMFTEWTAANEELWFEDIPSPRRTS